MIIETQQEQLRQHYLAAMGMTLWLPRQPLPGAAASPVWHWQAAKQNTFSSSVPVVSGAAATLRPVANGAPLRALLNSATEVVTAKAGRQHSSTDPIAAPAVSLPSPLGVSEHNTVDSVAIAPVALENRIAATPVTTAVPRFRLAMISYSDCLVITELPASHAQPWSAQHQQLLDAIVAAVGLGGGSKASSGVREFQWPLDPQAKFDQSEPIARHALEVELAGVEQMSHLVLLLMGQSAQEYLLPPGQEWVTGALIERPKGCPLLCCHGLNEVLRLPGLKAELWRQLQPVRGLPAEHR